MTVVFQDDLIHPSSSALLEAWTPDVGTSWTRLWGTDASTRSLQVITTGVRCSGNSGDYGLIYTCDATYLSADYDNVFTYVGAFSDITPLYALLRVQDQENMYAVILRDGTGNCSLCKKVSGTWTALGSTFNPPADGSVCKLEIIGTALKFYDDGVEIASATDSAISAAGKAGFAHGGGAELVTSTHDVRAFVMFHTVTVTDLGSSPVNLSGVGNIASAEALGSVVVSADLVPSGVSSGEAFGAPAMSVDLAGAGNIASGEAFGTLSAEAQVSGFSGIASAEAFGTPTVSSAVTAASVGSAEAFGGLSLSVDIASAGNIASLEVFGTPNVSTEAPVNLTDVGGIASAEAFGIPAFEARLEPAGIASSELFGAPAFVVSVSPMGIASLEAFGAPLVGNVFRTITVDSVAVETAQVSCAVDAQVSVAAMVQTLYGVESEDAP